MAAAGLGKAKGALLATARQGSCFLPIVYPLAWLFDANGVASVQAVADGLTFFLAFPLIWRVLKEVKGKAAECGSFKQIINPRQSRGFLFIPPQPGGDAPRRGCFPGPT